jgi:hypothetical protein
MKSSHYFLIAILVFAAFAGWGVANYEHKRRVELAETEALAEALKPGLLLAKLIREGDAATLAYLPDKDGVERIVQINDPQWRERLALVFEGAKCEATGEHIMALSQPMIQIKKKGNLVLTLMVFRKVIRPFCDSIRTDLIVSEEIAASIGKLVREQENPTLLGS